MSLPTFSDVNPPACTEESLNMILASIAMEEAGLGRIISAEAEKLQYVLGCGCKKPPKEATVAELLAINKSIKTLLDSVAQNQMLLKNKMESALEAFPPCQNCCPNPCQNCCPSPQCCGSFMAFSGCKNDCLCPHRAIEWSNHCCWKDFLTDDHRAIRLADDRCYAVSFAVDFCAPKGGCVELTLRANRCNSPDKFVYHAPSLPQNALFTASLSGVLINSCKCGCDLSLVLTSNDAIKINNASIFICEISPN